MTASDSIIDILDDHTKKNYEELMNLVSNYFKKQTKFLLSATQPRQYPNVSFPEIAFIGRSNVGKSSLINSLTKTKKLAKNCKSLKYWMAVMRRPLTREFSLELNRPGTKIIRTARHKLILSNLSLEKKEVVFGIDETTQREDNSSQKENAEGHKRVCKREVCKEQR